MSKGNEGNLILITKHGNDKHAARISDNDKTSLLSSGDERENEEEYTDIFGGSQKTSSLIPPGVISNLDEGDSTSASDNEIRGYTGDVEMYTDAKEEEEEEKDDDDGEEKEGEYKRAIDTNSIVKEGILINIDGCQETEINDSDLLGEDDDINSKPLSNHTVSEIASKLEEVKMMPQVNKPPGQPVKVSEVEDNYAKELGLTVKIDSLDDNTDYEEGETQESFGYLSSGEASQQPRQPKSVLKKKKMRKRTSSNPAEDHENVLENELNSSGDFIEQNQQQRMANSLPENRHLKKERKKKKETHKVEQQGSGDLLVVTSTTAKLTTTQQGVVESVKQYKQSASKKSSSRRRRMRYKIYLDDPDIHQLINDHVSLLHKFIEDVQAGRHLKNKSRQQQSQPQLYASTKSLPGSFQQPQNYQHSSANIYPSQSMQAIPSSMHNQSVHAIQHAGYTSGSYSGHGGIRGKNLITRIRNGDMSSSSDDEDFRYGGQKDLHNVCPDCGEFHEPDRHSVRVAQDVCPDCGVQHNPYEHGPNAQKPWQKYVDACQSRLKPGQRYEQVSTQQDPDDVKKDTFPSIEGPHNPDELREGVRYKLKYLGSSQIVTQHPVTKETRMQQAQEAYNRIKGSLDDDEDDVSTNVDMFISLERIKILNKETKFEDVMMDHALRTVCFICDMGKILVLMARRLTSDGSTDFTIEEGKPISLGTIVGEREKKTSKNICHVFEGEEDASIIAKVIGQAFNIAYRQFLESNGIAHEHVEEAEYCHVLESQKLVGQDLDRLTDQSNSKEVVVVKKRGESIGIMLLESGWGSMLPTVFIAHLANYSPAARCQQLTVGDHILSCNNSSLVGLPLSECNIILRNARAENRVVLKIVSCPPVVDVVVSRPDTKFQLGFSVQNGTICSLLRGGIAERGGVRVGHRIIEINGTSVVAKSHQYIVDILANTVGSISMKTMPVAMYRLMVGDDQPQHI